MTYLKLSSAVLAGYVFVAVISLASAHAGNNKHAVVRDARGHAVHNTTGNCVRTKWMDSSDMCDYLAGTEVEQTVFFNFNKSSLSGADKKQLAALAKMLKSRGDVSSVRVVGYADRLGNAEYNEKLSKKRAETVRNYLISKGVARPSSTEVRWMGEDSPATNCDEGMKRSELIKCLEGDRRVEIEVDYFGRVGR